LRKLGLRLDDQKYSIYLLYHQDSPFLAERVFFLEKDELPEIFVVGHIWQSRGFGLYPCQFDSKDAVRGHGPYAKNVVTGAELEFWFRYRKANLAVVAPSGCLVLDFDDIEVYKLFFATWPDLAKSYTEATPRGGRHIFLKSEKPIPVGIVLKPGIELKRFCLVYPSRVKGLKYSIAVTGKILAVDDIEEKLIPFLAVDPDKPSKYPRALTAGRPVLKQKPIRGQPVDWGVIERVKARWPILSYLAYFAPRLKLAGAGRWRSGLCPWHDDHHPSLWVDSARGLWGCHSCGAHGDVVDWHARLRTSDQGAAARDLDKYQVEVWA
jgi:hypothetical protein